MATEFQTAINLTARHYLILNKTYPLLIDHHSSTHTSSTPSHSSISHLMELASHYVSLFNIILALIGIVGNLFSIVVFACMRHVSTFRFLLYLSIFDSLVLLVCTTEASVKFGLLFEIRHLNPMMCRLHSFLTYLLTQCSTNLLMVINLDRALLITSKQLPLFNSSLRLKRRSTTVASSSQRGVSFSSRATLHSSSQVVEHTQFDRCCLIDSSTRVDVIVSVILITIALVNSHFLFLLDLSPTESDGFSSLICFPLNNQAYKSFIINVWTWIDFVIFGGIPLVGMSVCSFLIIAKLRENDRKYRSFLLDPFKRKESSHRRGTEVVCMDPTRQSNSTSILLMRGRQDEAYARRLKRNRTLLYLLLSTNIYFLLTSFPYFILSIIYMGKMSRHSTLDQNIAHLLLYSNNSLHFVFYGLSSEKYRQEFMRIILRRRSN